MSHTQGPWRIEETECAVIVVEPTGNNVAEFTKDTPESEAFFHEVGDDSRRIPSAEAIANARLLVAAPELLEALKSTAEIVAEELATIIDCHTLNGDRSTLTDDHALAAVERMERVLADARAAIAKATGGDL